VTKKSYGRRYCEYDGYGHGWKVSLSCWITNKDNDNWPRHTNFIDEHLPYELFLGKKEGDIVTFKHQNKIMRLRCKQMDCRYGGITFDQLALKILSHVNNVWEPSDGEPSEKTQRLMITEAYHKYKNSINL
jgi:hypothetical protein